MNQSLKKRYVLSLFLTFFLMICVLMPVTAQAASFKKSRPKFTKECAYENSQICLKWSKVKGAAKYEIQRAKIKPAKGKIGKWVKWKTVKKTSLKVKDTGDYKYRVRAVKGKKKKKQYSKWSAAKRIFTASAKITDIGYTPPDVMFGVTFHEGMIEFRTEVANQTQSEMGFVPSGSRFGKQNTFYALDKKSGKVIKKYEADLDTGTFSGIAKLVEARKTQSVFFYVYGVTEDEWAAIKNCKFMVTSSFYPNPYTEDISTQMAIAYTTDSRDSAIAAK